MKQSVGKETKLLAKHTTIYGLGIFFNKIVAFLLLPVYTRFLTPHDYGIKELVGISTEVVGLLVSVAISASIFRFYFEYDDEKERNEVISSAIIVLGIIGIIILSPFAIFSNYLARYILDAEKLYYFFWISFVSMWFQSQNDIAFNYLKARQKSLLFVTISLCRMILAISLNIYFIVVMGIGVLGILISTLIVALLTSLFVTIPILFKIGMHVSFEKIIEMLKFGLPSIPAQAGAFVVHLSDRFFIKGYCSIADAGLYSLGYRFGAIPANFIADPFNQIWQPRRFELYKQTGSEEMFGRIFTYFLCVILFAGLGVSVLTKDVLMIIADEKFWSAYKIVPIIVVATTIFTFASHFNMGILIYKKTKYLAYINGSNAFVVIVLNFLLIPSFGVYGAAVATLIAFIYKVSLTYFYSSKYYKIHFEFLRIFKIFLATLILYTGTVFIDSGSTYINFIVKTCIVLLFPIILYFLRFYSENEKDMISGYLRPGIDTVRNIFSLN
ncbi:MAG: oligosaccharide flippase family protein [Candidatus Cloacimonadia bacterium]